MPPPPAAEARRLARVWPGLGLPAATAGTPNQGARSGLDGEDEGCAHPVVVFTGGYSRGGWDHSLGSQDRGGYRRPQGHSTRCPSGTSGGTPPRARVVAHCADGSFCPTGRRILDDDRTAAFDTQAMSRSTEHAYLVSGEEEYDKVGDGPESDAAATDDGDQPIRSLRPDRPPSSPPT
jgi:hypothetical protein